MGQCIPSKGTRVPEWGTSLKSEKLGIPQAVRCSPGTNLPLMKFDFPSSDSLARDSCCNECHAKPPLIPLKVSRERTWMIARIAWIDCVGEKISLARIHHPLHMQESSAFPRDSMLSGKSPNSRGSGVMVSSPTAGIPPVEVVLADLSPILRPQQQRDSHPSLSISGKSIHQPKVRSDRSLWKEKNENRSRGRSLLNPNPHPSSASESKESFFWTPGQEQKSPFCVQSHRRVHNALRYVRSLLTPLSGGEGEESKVQWPSSILLQSPERRPDLAIMPRRDDFVTPLPTQNPLQMQSDGVSPKERQKLQTSILPDERAAQLLLRLLTPQTSSPSSSSIHPTRHLDGQASLSPLGLLPSEDPHSEAARESSRVCAQIASHTLTRMLVEHSRSALRIPDIDFGNDSDIETSGTEEEEEDEEEGGQISPDKTDKGAEEEEEDDHDDHCPHHRHHETSADSPEEQRRQLKYLLEQISSRLREHEMKDEEKHPTPECESHHDVPADHAETGRRIRSPPKAAFASKRRSSEFIVLPPEENPSQAAASSSIDPVSHLDRSAPRTPLQKPLPSPGNASSHQKLFPRLPTSVRAQRRRTVRITPTPRHHGRRRSRRHPPPPSPSIVRPMLPRDSPASFSASSLSSLSSISILRPEDSRMQSRTDLEAGPVRPPSPRIDWEQAFQELLRLPEATVYETARKYARLEQLGLDYLRERTGKRYPDRPWSPSGTPVYPTPLAEPSSGPRPSVRAQKSNDSDERKAFSGPGVTERSSWTVESMHFSQWTDGEDDSQHHQHQKQQEGQEEEGEEMEVLPMENDTTRVAPYNRFPVRLETSRVAERRSANFHSSFHSPPVRWRDEELLQHLKMSGAGETPKKHQLHTSVLLR